MNRRWFPKGQFHLFDFFLWVVCVFILVNFESFFIQQFEYLVECVVGLDHWFPMLQWHLKTVLILRSLVFFLLRQIHNWQQGIPSFGGSAADKLVVIERPLMKEKKWNRIKTPHFASESCSATRWVKWWSWHRKKS